MKDPRPIAILGFGRSGTTWLADILSKALGGLVLFEPLHPRVLDDAARYAYGPPRSDGDHLLDHFEAVLTKNHRRPWLLRNHVPHALHDMSEAWLERIWDECRVVGFKTIRGALMADWMRRQLDARTVHIVRHPAAVAASILRRENFWEFGWPETWQHFRSNAAGQELLDRDPGDDLGRIAIMWAVTVRAQLADAEASGSPLVIYEDLYREPFGGTRHLLASLGEESHGLHPSWIFTPAMTSHRTLHGLREKEDDLALGPSAFWRDTLDDAAVARLVTLARDAGIELWDEQGRCPPTDS